MKYPVAYKFESCCPSVSHFSKRFLPTAFYRSSIQTLRFRMQASSSSSSESSRSGSPFSRATTPSSHIAATYVYVHSDVLTPSALETLFERHASCDCMGLIIDHASSSDRSSFVYAAGEDEWVKTISDTQDIEYLTSSTYQAPAASNCVSCPHHALAMYCGYKCLS
jgi:hypothetical protein